jgi:hypothetical protein
MSKIQTTVKKNKLLGHSYQISTNVTENLPLLEIEQELKALKIFPCLLQLTSGKKPIYFLPKGSTVWGSSLSINKEGKVDVHIGYNSISFYDTSIPCYYSKFCVALNSAGEINVLSLISPLDQIYPSYSYGYVKFNDIEKKHEDCVGKIVISKHPDVLGDRSYAGRPLLGVSYVYPELIGAQEIYDFYKNKTKYSPKYLDVYWTGDKLISPMRHMPIIHIVSQYYWYIKNKSNFTSYKPKMMYATKGTYRQRGILLRENFNIDEFAYTTRHGKGPTYTPLSGNDISYLKERNIKLVPDPREYLNNESPFKV